MTPRWIALSLWMVAWALLYGLGAFVAWSWNPATWTGEGRAILGIIGGGVAILCAAAVVMDENT